MTGLALDTKLNDEQHEYIETIRTSGEVLLTLIDDILDLSKIEAQRMELEQAPFNLRRCIEEAFDLLQVKSTQKKLELAYSIDREVPNSFLGDVTRLRQILVNLLNNAIKFTEQGEVIVSVAGQFLENNQYRLHFSVKDTGIGISAEGMEQLFKSFSQVDASITRRFGGAGLGLVISKCLSELMGGTLWAESRGIPGQGSIFHFTILTQEAQGSQTLRPVTKPLFNREIGSQHPLRLLVAEDNEINQKLVVSILGRLGYQAELANNGLEVLKILNEKPFDAVLMDVQMPEMDGETATIHIRRDFPPDRQPRVIAMTANALPGERERYLAVGMDDYLSKPIRIDELVRVLKESKPLGQPNSTTSPVDNGLRKVSPAPVQPPAGSFDMSLLHEFSEMMGEDGIELAKELLRMYRKNSLDLIDSLQHTLDKQNLPDLHRVAHTLKGNSSQVGAVRLSGLCFTLEQITQNGSWDGAQAVLEQIKAEFGKVECEIEKVLHLSEPAWYAFNGKIN
jgi:CheY-like chemotaxis protein